MATPVIHKDIVVARAGRNFVNGRQEFDLTQANIDDIIKNFGILKKQVPLLLTDDHLFGGQRSAVPASGWVEAMYRDGDDWHAKVKLIGDAAIMVANDQFRGVSIGTVMGRDVHGTPVGEVLDHLLITNSPFFPNLNIAASVDESAARISDGRVRYLTSQPWVDRPKKGEPTMSDKTVVLDAAVKALIETKDNELVALKAANLQLQEENETLNARLANSVSTEDMSKIQNENVALKRENFAVKVRAVVAMGLQSGRLKPSVCSGFMGKSALDFDGTLQWLKASSFGLSAEGNDDLAFKILYHTAEKGPVINRIGATFATGAPTADLVMKKPLTEDERANIKKLGLDPDRIAEAPSDGRRSEPENYDQWKARKAAKESN